MKNLLVILFVIAFFKLSAQTYNVGYQYMTAYDESRDRDISTTVYYPSDIGGEDAAIADGAFPAIIFGHGTAMADETLYDYIYEAAATQGYILLFPTTEDDSPPLGAPDHESFGLDLQYLNLVIKAENDNSESFFYGHVTDKTAIMGHSLGGKGTLIAASNNTDVTTIITLCAALSDPPWPYDGNGYDVINNSMPNITVPSLVVDAEFDCVVEEGYGKYVTYELLENVTCKTYVNIIGGGHCYMASSDGTCETAEGWMGGNCSGDFTITREEQNNTVLDIIMPYLDYYLKEDDASMSEFLCYLNTTSACTFERACDLSNAEIASVDDYNEVQNVTVAYGTDLSTATAQLVQEITISDFYGVEYQVTLNWDSPTYNATTPGTYPANGSFTLPECVEQTTPETPLQVVAQIIVDDPVGVEDCQMLGQVAIYPNPAKGLLFYKNFSDTNPVVHFYNVCGQQIKQVNFSIDGTIDISDMKSGIYILKSENSSYKLIVK